MQFLLKYMGWAIFWAFFIGSAATADKSGASAGLLSFFVILYFANKADTLNKVGQRMVDERQSRIDELELAQNKHDIPPKKEWGENDWFLEKVNKDYEESQKYQINP